VGSSGGRLYETPITNKMDLRSNANRTKKMNSVRKEKKKSWGRNILSFLRRLFNIKKRSTDETETRQNDDDLPALRIEKQYEIAISSDEAAKSSMAEKSVEVVDDQPIRHNQTSKSAFKDERETRSEQNHPTESTREIKRALDVPGSWTKIKRDAGEKCATVDWVAITGQY